MAQMDAIGRVHWHRSLNREQWRVLIAANLGWLFDGFEIYALFLTVGFALKQLLVVGQAAAIPQYAGYILAFTVFGWATGGVIGGIVADYIGRKRTMLLAILAYSLTTGLSAFAWDWVSFAVLRFLVGVAIGSEWATGASIVSEVWPDHGARQRRRAAAGRIRAGQHSRLVGLAGDHVGQSGGLVGDAGPTRLALSLSDRCVAGLGGIVDSAQRP
jgi:MFS family permease